MLDLINKKAIALYRVSTEKQTSKEDKDIPAQKELVHEFVNKNQLILIKEFTEGGISGYKTKMKDRDALIAIKKMAVNKEFEVLIVYKSDRIGRTSDESPMVIKYLNDQGIRVVTCSGEEIKTHTQVDKLMTYLTFWQNESESVKLSERATDYQILQLKNGQYRGGGKKTIPFGYRLVNKGSVNFKGKNILDFEIDPEEAEIVKLIYRLSFENNMGGRSIASYLNTHGYKDKAKSDNGWIYSTINYMLNNIMYKGYFHMYSELYEKEIISPLQEHLIIIPEDVWNKNQEVVKNRINIGEFRGITKSDHSLFSGLVYCGHCGEKMTVWANHKKYNRKNGYEVKFATYRYRCPSSVVKGRHDCEGQSTYGCNKVDQLVENDVFLYLCEETKNESSESTIQKYKSEYNRLTAEKNNNNKELKDLNKKIEVLKEEIPNTIYCELYDKDKVKFSSIMLKESLESLQKKKQYIENRLQILDKQIDDLNKMVDTESNKNDLTDNWTLKYNNAAFEDKKALLSFVVQRVYVFRNKVKPVLNIDFERFSSSNL
ncbi:recombinase family protein [Acetivibrio cellulolyticus]|uniref:recombinase family protein n=1 Tax=Acetivibrio cellulolyticus TaxID=35830 RepID=UPI0001E2BDD0|nr:recombinase family protein [Acetivibrio cellulolyticus]